jgi:lipopolysaccharide/colanic/teichoic acid biosynthesis glycosyltransferase
MYRKYFKRILDFLLALCALIILSPVILILTILGSIAMKGNPFYTQPRPGRNEKIFRMLKFRTMSNAKDKNGKLLPDNVRLNKYGRFLRSTSLDELPELINILKGDMSIVGPRPLMSRYLPYYTEEERRRHSVRPGLTGYAQVHGRNTLTWDERFQYDLQYVDHLTFIMDIKIIIDTIKTVLKREGIELKELGNLDDYRVIQSTPTENKRV